MDQGPLNIGMATRHPIAAAIARTSSASTAISVLWEHLVGESFAHFDVELHAFVWMTNHVHMLTRCDDGDLSAAMQRLCFRYASAYNERTGREGPLFTGRFRNEPILSDAQLHQAARYIHRNPLAMVPAAALDTYRWSSLGPLVGARAVPDWLSTGVVGGPDYLRYVLDPQPGDRVASGSFSPALSCDDVDVVVSAVTASRDRASATMAVTGAVRKSVRWR